MDYKKSNLLLIHNRGTLANKSADNLAYHFNIKSFLVEKDVSLEIIFRRILNTVEIKELDLLVFISGETRNRKNMMKFNFELPSKVSQLCDTKNIPFVYLSSLSVYGTPKSNLVYTNSNKIPFNEYGKTKLMFDDFIKNKLLKLKFCSIAPGTIINPSSSKNNLIKKGIKILSSKPLIWILSIISPAGNYACVHIDDLVTCLVKECIKINDVKDKEIYKVFKNCCTKIKIYDLVFYIIGRQPIFKISHIPISLINIISVFFYKTFKMTLLVYLADIEYINEYDFLKKRPLSKYLN